MVCGMSQVFLERAHAQEMDAAEPLAGFRGRFALDDPSLVYLNGNSLGALPLATLRRMEAVLGEEWGAALARSWDHWVDLPGRAGDLVGELTGAASGQVLVADNTTVNLYKLACAALDARPGRHAIVTDRDNFPSDRYVLEGIAAQRGAELRMMSTDIDQGVDPGEVRAAVDEDTPPAAGPGRGGGGARWLLGGGLGRMRAKSRGLTSSLIARGGAWLEPLGCALATPRDGARRGGHVSYRHPRAEQIVGLLADANIVTDYRTPDRFRFGLSPLTTRFTDVWTAVAATRDIIETTCGEDHG